MRNSTICAIKTYRVDNIKFIDKGFYEIHSKINLEGGFHKFIYIGTNYSYHRITSQVLDLSKISESYLILEKDIADFSWKDLDSRVLVYRAGNCKISDSDMERIILMNGRFNGFKKMNRELGTIYEFY